MVVRELITRLGFNVQEGQLRKYQQGTENIKRSAEGAADAFRNMFVAFVGFNALRSLANTADQMQSLQARIGLLPQTVGDAGEAFDLVAKKASESRASIEGYGTLYVRLAGATKDFITKQEDVLAITSSISDAMVVGGATMAEANSAMLQLSQGFQKGKLDGDEFRAFMETMSTGVKDKLAKALGKDSSAALFEMSKSGELTAKNLAAAFKEIGPAIRAEMLTIPLTIGQATTLVGNRWGEFIHRMNRESGAVTKIAGFFISTFDKIEIGLKKMVDFFGGATQTLKFFGIALAAVLVPLAAKLLVGALAFMVSPLGLVIAGLVLLGLVIEDIYQWMTGGKSVIGRWLGEFESFANALNTGILGKVWAFVVSVGDFFKELIPFGFIWQGIKLIFGGLLDAVVGILSIIGGLFKILFGILTGDFELVWEGLKNIFFGLGDIIKGVAKILAGAFMEAIAIIGVSVYTLFASVGKFIYNTIFGGISKAIKAGLSFFGFDFAPKQITPATAAGASSPGGVPRAGGVTNVTVNQTLPPGTSAETAEWSKRATKQALNDNAMERLARQTGQAQ